jgi:hypothetical protein
MLRVVIDSDDHIDRRPTGERTRTNQCWKAYRESTTPLLASLCPLIFAKVATKPNVHLLAEFGADALF